MTEAVLSPPAVEALARALCGPRSYTDESLGRLRIPGADLPLIQELLPLLTGVEIEQWDGDTGARYRDYVGTLPCGVPLVVSTDADRVPLVEPPS